MPTTDTTSAIKANALAIALREWNQGIHGYVDLTAIVAKSIASLEHKSEHDPNVLGRARVAAAYVIASKTGNDYPGGITAVIGNAVGALPFVPSPVDQAGNPIPKPTASGIIQDAVTAPVTIAEFLGRLSDVHIWIRIGEVTGGAVLIVIGIRMLARESGIDIPIPRIPKVG